MSSSSGIGGRGTRGVSTTQVPDVPAQTGVDAQDAGSRDTSTARAPGSTTQPGATSRGTSTSGTPVAPSDGANFGQAQVAADGQVTVDGVTLALDTPEGTQALITAVGDDQNFADLAAMLRLKQVETRQGPVLVPDDSFKTIDTGAITQRTGPQSVQGGDDLDQELGAWFESQGIPNPYNANTTPRLQQQLNADTTSDYTLSGATKMLVDLAKNPTPQRLDGFADYMKGLEVQNPHGNIMEVLFLVFRQSIEETNEDKKYYLQKLMMYNEMGEALSDYLSTLVDASRDLGAEASGQKYPEMVLTAEPVEVKKFDLSTTNTDGKLVTLSTESIRLDRAGLNDTIKEVESMQETVRNKRQMASTAFQNFDQKANQLYNLMSSVMKAMNEMRMGTVRNML